MKLKLFMILAVLAAVPSWAGDTLRLKAVGNIKPASYAAATVTQAAEPGLYLVQWKGRVSEKDKRVLEGLGFELLSYIPDDAFLAKGDRRQAERAAELPFAGAVLPFTAEMKIEPELSAAGVFGFDRITMVTVRMVPGAAAPGLGREVSAGEGIYVGEAAVGSFWQMAKRADVLWIERFLPMESMDFRVSSEGERVASQTGYESGAKLMNTESAYGRGITGQGQIVAFADTGLDSGELGTLIADFRGQVKSGFAMGLGGSSWGDPMNHGTHVAGSIAGSGSSSGGSIRGAAFGAKLVAQGMWSDIMNNIMPPSIPKLFEGAQREGARIHSNSWGAPNSNGRYDSWASLADDWSFKNPDFLPVFAAGNDGADRNRDGVVDEGSVSSPGSAKNVLTVGASKNLLLEGGIQRPMRELRDGENKWGVEPLASSKLSEDPRGMAAFSSRGPTADGRLKPEVVAPGTNIVSARSRHPKADPAMSWGVYDDHYLYMGGTSMATPLVAGAMALVRQHLLARLQVESVSSALLKAAVANTAEDLFPGQFGKRSQGQEQPKARPNNHQGWGRVDLAALVENGSLVFRDNRVGLKTGDSAVEELAVSDGKPVKVTLAYTDAPAAANSSKTLVNDLDLEVISPSGKTHYPNGRNGKDSTNNLEQVDILEPESGTYRIVVKGANVPQGKNGAQPFALVVSSGR